MTNQLTDSQKLRLLADWFDLQDKKNHLPWEQSNTEVQTDLRRIADKMEAPDA